MNEPDQTETPSHPPLPASPDALVAYVDDRQQHWASRTDVPVQRRLLNFTVEVLHLLDRLDVQAVSTPDARAFAEEGGENHHADGVPLHGGLMDAFGRTWDAHARGAALPAIERASTPPRAFTREETQAQLAELLTVAVMYVEAFPSGQPVQRLAGSVLGLMDGGTVSFPGLRVRGPDGTDLAGTLATRFHVRHAGTLTFPSPMPE